VPSLFLVSLCYQLQFLWLFQFVYIVKCVKYSNSLIEYSIQDEMKLHLNCTYNHVFYICIISNDLSIRVSPLQFWDVVNFDVNWIQLLGYSYSVISRCIRWLSYLLGLCFYGGLIKTRMVVTTWYHWCSFRDCLVRQKRYNCCSSLVINNVF